MRLWVLTFLVGTSGAAMAGDYYILDIYSDQGVEVAVVVEGPSIKDARGGHRTAAVSNVDAFNVDIDVSNAEFDCTGRQWKVNSETLFDSVGKHPPLDKTDLNDKAWTAVNTGSLGEALLDFVCGWPNVPSDLPKVVEPDLLGMASDVSAILSVTTPGSGDADQNQSGEQDQDNDPNGAPDNNAPTLHPPSGDATNQL